MLTFNGTSGLTFPDGTTQNTQALPGMRNRIINGDMRIDQRYAGAGVSTVQYANYIVDRFNVFTSVASKFSSQRNQGSVTPPSGFTNYLGVTCSSAYTPTTVNAFLIYQGIEGVNVADLDFGKATAKNITVSFWARSNLTGNFAFALRNNALNRQYVTSYNISSANTWQYITLTIPGDTTGTWAIDNTAGINVCWDLGSGSDYNVTNTNVWGNQGSNQGYTFSGAAQVITGTGNYLYITGVQLEKGSTATPFEYRPYGAELALCQRYYCKSYDINTVPGTSTAYGSTGSTSINSNYRHPVRFPVNMRTSPTFTAYNGSTGATGTWRDSSGVDRSLAIGQGESCVLVTCTTNALDSFYSGHWTASAEL